jgi:hypothetical protein
MGKSISVNAKKRGRPRTTGTGRIVGVRLLPDSMEALDAWRAEQEDQPSRPEAIRRIVAEKLERRED